jgi:hypothetical protein
MVELCVIYYYDFQIPTSHQQKIYYNVIKNKQCLDHLELQVFVFLEMKT